MPEYLIDYTLTYSETHSTRVEAQTPEDAIASIRNDAPNIRKRLSTGAGYTDVAIHVVEPCGERQKQSDLIQYLTDWQRQQA